MAYVVLEASGQLLKINASNKSIVATLTLAPTVRHIAISTDESQLYISRYVSPTMRIESPSIPTSKESGGEIFVVRTDTFALKNKIILGLNNGIDSEKNARGLPNYLGGMALSPDGQTAWVPSKQDNIQRGEMRDGLALTFDSAVRSISSKVNLVTNKEDLSARMDHDNGGIASAAIFGRYGSYLFVALEGSRAIDVIDAYNNESLFRLKTERAPQSLAISDDGLTLFSYNFTDRSVTVYDIFNLIYSQSNDVRLIGTLNTVSQEKLSASVLRGKQFFYDSFDERLAKEQYLSCAGCHNEGGTDGRVWDMTNLGEGFRNTISLIGHGGTYAC